MSALRLPWQSSGYDSAISMQGAQVQSLVRELRSHRLQGTVKKLKRKLKKELSALPNANHWSLKDVTCTELVALRWLLGTHTRLEDRKINLDKAPETKTKDNSSAGQALYYFVWWCPKWKSKISVMLSPNPCTFLHTLFLDITQWKENRHSHNRHFTYCNATIVPFLLYSDGEHNPGTASENHCEMSWWVSQTS